MIREGYVLALFLQIHFIFSFFFFCYGKNYHRLYTIEVVFSSIYKFFL